MVIKYSSVIYAVYINVKWDNIYTISFFSETLEEILFRLQSLTDEMAAKNIVNVNRADILDSLMRMFAKDRFRPEARLDVKFAGECAYDAGGPMREAMRLAIRAIPHLPIFEGPEAARQLVIDYKGLSFCMCQNQIPCLFFSLILTSSCKGLKLLLNNISVLCSF